MLAHRKPRTVTVHAGACRPADRLPWPMRRRRAVASGGERRGNLDRLIRPGPLPAFLFLCGPQPPNVVRSTSSVSCAIVSTSSSSAK
jgi:hypothetical protein